MASRQQHLVGQTVMLQWKENIVTLNEVESCEGEEQGSQSSAEAASRLISTTGAWGGKLIEA